MNIKCPACGYTNTPEEDRCGQCLESLMVRDIKKIKKLDRLQQTMMKVPIADLLTGEDLLVASPSDTIQKVVKILQEKNKSCVLVYKKKKLVGILSNRDILLKVADPKQDLSKIKVEQVMTVNPEYVKPEDPIAFIVNKMALGGFRNVPVLQEDGNPISIILIKDVLNYLSSRSKNKPFV